jgi:hypothetical protein
MTKIFYYFWDKTKTAKPHSLYSSIHLLEVTNIPCQEAEKFRVVKTTPKTTSYSRDSRSQTDSPEKVPKNCHLLFCSIQKWLKQGLKITHLYVQHNNCPNWWWMEYYVKDLPWNYCTWILYEFQKHLSIVFHILNYYFFNICSLANNSGFQTCLVWPHSLESYGRI